MDFNRFTVPAGAVSLKDFDSGDPCGYANKDTAKDDLNGDIRELQRLQDVLSAQARFGVLVIFQGMDTAGKDGAVKHVMSGLNPVSVNVYGFRAPSEDERKHDFLWRYSKALPQRGRFAIFNRSYYEDVLIARVHPNLLSPPQTDPPKSFWDRRYEAINAFEEHLLQEGTVVLKFFLHLSKREQSNRLRARIADPAKQWKCSVADWQEREFWNDYMRAYERALHHTSTAAAPWYVIPADHKYVARVAIASVIIARLKRLDLSYPRISPPVLEAVTAMSEGDYP